MFAVPGWSVSAEDLVSEKASSKSDHAPKREGAEKEHKRKRKRGSTAPEEVKAADLEKAWKKQFEGGDSGESKRKRRKRDRKAGRNQENSSLASEGQKYADDGQEVYAKRVVAPFKTSKEEIFNDGGRNGNSAATNGAIHRSQSQSDTILDIQEPSKRKPKKSKSQTVQLFPTSASLPPPRPPQAPSTTHLTPLQTKMRAKLLSARFRHLNETLYTTSSQSSLSLFASDPSLFSEYHTGFSQQVQDSWPQNPVAQYIDTIQRRGQVRDDGGKGGHSGGAGRGQFQKKRGKAGLAPLPRRPNGVCTIADLGCGDASLARTLDPVSERLGLHIHSYDLHASNEHVTKADIANLPLKNGQVDIAIFCLSLMGTNWVDFVEEAWRVLRGDGKGECWVSEVKSRFGRPKIKASNSKGQGSGKARNKNQKPSGKKGSAIEEDWIDEPAHEQIFAEDKNSAVANRGSAENATDIAPFVRVFERRGFVLRPETVQRDNKMFIAMGFVKSGVPRAGRWRGMKWTGGRYERVEVEDGGEEAEVEDEGKVLKPCVYKIR